MSSIAPGTVQLGIQQGRPTLAGSQDSVFRFCHIGHLT